jgi:hypothetical protein
VPSAARFALVPDPPPLASEHPLTACVVVVQDAKAAVDECRQEIQRLRARSASRPPGLASRILRLLGVP